MVDPHSGRIRAVVNPRLAFEQAFPLRPHVMKVFTAPTAAPQRDSSTENRALSAGALIGSATISDLLSSQEQDTLQSRSGDWLLLQLLLRDLGSRLSPGSFVSTLSLLGFGKQDGSECGRRGLKARLLTGVEYRRCSRRRQGRHRHHGSTSRGLYGRCSTADTSSSATGGFAKGRRDEQGSLRIDPAHRRTLIAGMRGAVEYGTGRPRLG